MTPSPSVRYRFAVSQAANDLGTWIGRTALLERLFLLPHGALIDASLIVCDAVPRICVRFIVLRLEGHRSRRLTVSSGLLIQSVLTLTLLAELSTVWLVLLLLACRALVDATVQIGVQAAIAEVSEKDVKGLARLNGTVGSASAASVLAGPAVGAVLFGLVGIGSTLVIDASSFIVAAATLYPILSAESMEIGNARAARGDSPHTLKRVCVANGLSLVGGGAFNDILPLVATLDGAFRSGAIGAALVAFGGGAVLGGILTSKDIPAISPEIRASVALISGSAGIFFLGLSRGYVSLALFICVGSASSWRSTSFRTIAQVSSIKASLASARLQASSAVGILIGSGIGLALTELGHLWVSTTIIASLYLGAWAIQTRWRPTEFMPVSQQGV